MMRVEMTLVCDPSNRVNLSVPMPGVKKGEERACECTVSDEGCAALCSAVCRGLFLCLGLMFETSPNNGFQQSLYVLYTVNNAQLLSVFVMFTISR